MPKCFAQSLLLPQSYLKCRHIGTCQSNQKQQINLLETKNAPSIRNLRRAVLVSRPQVHISNALVHISKINLFMKFLKMCPKLTIFPQKLILVAVSNQRKNFPFAAGLLYKSQSSTSHNIFLMRWCAKNLAQNINFSSNWMDF